jgi:hypothetical protein
VAYQLARDAALRRGCSLHQRFYGRAPECIARARIESTSAPRVLVALGELRALVYRAARAPGGPGGRSYVHFFEQPPALLADAAGRRLFIAGGRYRVTRRGIEG